MLFKIWYEDFLMEDIDNSVEKRGYSDEAVIQR